ncbi:hypothetical protein, partial [Amycolatopsis methanolica]|uniref:hypothetical protein n=1 Tax=Amycolatopsis methanolica TaxID=1814 RepID=UPI003449F5C9
QGHGWPSRAGAIGTPAQTRLATHEGTTGTLTRTRLAAHEGTTGPLAQAGLAHSRGHDPPRGHDWHLAKARRAART